MNLVIDTNVMVESITSKSPYHKIFRSLTDMTNNICAICGNCDFLITSDHHFNVLEEIEFPKVEVISPKDFIKKYL